MIFEKGQLFRYTERQTTFVISSVEKVLQPIAGHVWYADIFEEGVVHQMRLSELRIWLEHDKIRLVK